MRVFLDTNVLIAAFATRGICEDVFRTVLAEHSLIVSDVVLNELERILTAKLRIPAREVGAITAFVRSEAEIVSPSKAAALPERDPDDRWIVAAAIDGHVDYLVTGDRDLLEVADEILVTVVSPRGFWENLR